LIILNIIFIYINRNKRVIKETGFYKHIIYSVGTILIFLSSFFGVYKNYFFCALNFILYHYGLFLIYSVIIIIYQLNIALGIDPINNNIKYSQNRTSFSENDVSEDNYIKNINNNISTENHNISERKLHLTINTNNINYLFKNIMAIKSLYSLILSCYVVLIIILVIIITVKGFEENNNEIDENERYIKDISKKYIYNCSLTHYNTGLSMIEILFLIPLILKCRKVWSYECIFKMINYLNYSIPIWVTTGPLAKVIKNYYMILFYLY